MDNFWKTSAIIMFLLVALLFIGCGFPFILPEKVGETTDTSSVQISATPEAITGASTSPLPTPTPTSSPSPPPPTYTPSPTPTHISPSSSALPVRVGKYEFSQPKRIFSGQAIQVIDWLPDGQHLLITQPNVDGKGRRLIEVVDLNGQQVISFGNWYVSPHAPIVFSPTDETITFIGYDNEDPNSPGVMVVNKDASSAIIADETAYFGASSDSANLWAIDTQGNILTAPSSGAVLQEKMTISTLSLAQVNAANQEQEMNSGAPLSIVTNPANPDQAIIFNDIAFLVADLNTGKLTEIDLGEEHSQRASGKYWILEARWSPDGRQIATKTTVGQAPITGFSNLTILDTTTWNYRRVEEPDIFSGGMTWLPNSTDMLIRVDNNSMAGWGVGDIHLFDTKSLESQPLPIFPENLVHSSGANILVSPDGQKFITPCVLLGEANFDDPSKTIRQICLIDIIIHP